MDALVTAAAQVLVKRGYDGTTTARVAERAGVSVGSLYQYFPNKEALVAALIERHANEIVVVNRRALESPEAATLEGGLRAAIRAGVDSHRIDPVLHKILVEQVPRIGRMAKAMDTSRQITQALEGHLRRHARMLRRGLDPAVAAVVVETALEALTHKAVTERRDLLAGGIVEREAYALIANYLLPPGRHR
ncbi:TetR/AcrR family transcriptional regulator [Reyranella sp. CPCC 100927]|uniref:TetR/AcrR family transcriptional regulator n=1 Tax=Reyranella sp. CPCC 100927 TaxID=2599616 RepID=UPI0021035B49|nr:TetR/AcrR family transcriptional regulator [Reyranella sp. CPCC 100927]